ncbi:molybdopterin-dependent oxidoreductase [Caulobacter segnis]|uniref:molybdopterin-dependent oxidoreductase n=1 Tax=Caulobacter segnis TaxID=88688 RepID=UPI00240ED0FF|nr:molybdopterin-dependent oxidoreductase [Caulobacter segnis]MDG2521123.1 molybdopterin-dependent oxidoreductase [Caulobacter segnis]
MRFPVAAFAVALLAVTPALAQELKVQTSTGTKAVTAAEIAKLPRLSLAVQWHGQSATYEGPLLSDILNLAGGVPLGEALRGAALANVVIADASDGYRIALALAEVDPAMSTRRVIVADRKDGQPLPAAEAPFRLVVEGDKRPARSARNLISIKVAPAN